MDRPKIIHVIGSLDVGGAQVALCKLLSQIDLSKARYQVISLIPGGALAENIKKLGITVDSIGMRRRIPNPLGLLRLIELFKRERPAVIVTWMYHSNLIGGIAAAVAGRIPTIWNIRNSGAEKSPYRLMTRLIAHAATLASHVLSPQIAFVSNASLRAHAKRGYACEGSVVIPNGFDTSKFQPSEEARLAIRSELGLKPSTRLIGLIARVHPDKDHSNFLMAASRVHTVDPDARFLLCGEGATNNNPYLAQQLQAVGISPAMHLLGPRLDMPRIAASLDVAVLSSSAEAFPNAAGEAMSCGVPCVVTDVGDSAFLIDDTGAVVPPRDPVSLANAMLAMLRLPVEQLRNLGMKARQRIVDNFSIEKIAPRYENLWLSAAGPLANPIYSDAQDRKAA